MKASSQRPRKYRQAQADRNAAAGRARWAICSGFVVGAVLAVAWFATRGNLGDGLHIRTFEHRSSTFLERIADDPEFAADVDDILADLQHSLEAGIEQIEKGGE